MTEGSLVYNFASMNFLKFSSFFFLYCVAIAVLVSMFTKADEGKDLNGLTISTVEATRIKPKTKKALAGLISEPVYL